VSRRAQTLLLFLLGTVVLKITFGGQYLRFLRPGFRPVLLAAGAALLVLAAATGWYELRAAVAHWRNGSAHDADPSTEPVHAHHEPRIAWLLVLPLVALLAALPPALGSYAAERAGTGLQPPPGFPVLPAGNPVRLTLDDYATRAVYQHGRSLNGRTVELIGFIGFGGGGTPYLIRMLINCCAADAMPIKIALAGNVPLGLPADTWLRITGTYLPRQTTDDVNGGPIPYLTVDQVTTVPPPTDPYET
jgi:uncharacterized repeat protein (TIGR03943 family)